jgi:hypothetical protein
MALRFPLILAAVLVLASLVAARADPAPFDLAGPTLEVTVTRGAKTLPIAEVPNLAPGDRLVIKADLPSTQSAPYLLVAAFLRGATNPPPRGWFFRCETWKRRCAEHGLDLRVPPDAQQVLVFLAPKTGGGFRTLVGAVRGLPGSFVRASQDLNQAMLDRSRLESYLSAIRALNDADPAKLKTVAPLLGRSLSIQVNQDCLRKIPVLEVPCLLQDQGSLILNDGHSTSIVEALTSGPATDLAMEASYTPELRYGYFSPYVASVLDIARILGSFATAQYRYIPALATERGDTLALTLSEAPSFHDPLSVLVTALPAIEKPQLPPLHAVDPKAIYCARQSSLVLPVEGAPLVFSTRYAHDMALELSGGNGSSITLPARADPARGGYVIDTAHLGDASRLGDSIHGSLRGHWGFVPYDGPEFQLVNAHAQSWQLDTGADGELIVGREDTVHLRAGSLSCVDSIMLRDPAGKELKVDWKTVKPGEMELELPLKAATPGDMTLLVKQYGAKEPERVPLQAFSEAGHLTSFTLYAGDTEGVLNGSRLDEVASLVFDGIKFLPGTLSTSLGTDQLTMAAADAKSAAALRVGAHGRGVVALKDGRVLRLGVTVGAPRPSVALIGKSVAPSHSSRDSHIELENPNEVPQDAVLTFSVRTKTPATFGRNDAIDVATADGSFSTALDLANGGITLESSEVAVATLDPVKAFGASAFGPLKFRVVADGVPGGWQPLAILVRLPRLAGLTCPATRELACKLSGVDLYLVDALAVGPKFAHPVEVPDGFPGYALPVPHPDRGWLYVRLRDDPSVVNRAALDVEELPPTPQEAARAAVRRAAAQADARASVVPAESPYPAALPPGRPATRRAAPAGTSTTGPAGVSATEPAGTPAGLDP